MADANTSDTNINSQHPSYAAYHESWTRMRDCYDGERAIKAKRTEYLPPTAGMLLDGMGDGQVGAAAYNAYLKRAVFRSYVSDAVEAMIGFMHKQPPTIELPPELEDLRENATLYGESLELLLRRINEQQLVTGRIGLFADLPAKTVTGPVLPYIVTYTAESIINWDDGTTDEDTLSNLNMVVLNESGPMRGPMFRWYDVEQYRVLMLIESLYQVGVFRNNVTGVPLPENVHPDLNFSESAMMQPMLMGQPLDTLPFVFVNSKDIVPVPDDPPLMELGNLCLAIYRGEADYRQTLHKQGQDTLVVIGGQRTDGGEGTWRIGSGASIDVDPGGDAKFIGVSAAGIEGQRNGIKDDKEEAIAKSGVLITSDSGSNNESGEALAIRVAARTATLVQIAQSGAAGLEKILRIIAKWRGADPEKVRVSPSIDFTGGELSGQDLVQLMTAKQLGAPISKSTIHEIMVDRGLTSKKYKDELEEIDNEVDDRLGNPGGTRVGGNPEDDQDPLDPNGGDGGE